MVILNLQRLDVFICASGRYVNSVSPPVDLAVSQFLWLSDVEDKAAHFNKWYWSIVSHWSQSVGK